MPLGGSLRCPRCGTENPLGQRHCNACGGQLGPVSTATPAPEPRRTTPEHLAAKIRAGAGALEGERKQVSVLFADVVGSMDLTMQAGAEEWREIMERIYVVCCDAVHRYEGTIDKFTGDGVMALFGAPIAHEDHARRACYAALELQEELAAYAVELRRGTGLELAVRIGLNSGEVVVGAIGEDLTMDYTAIGHTVGLAQRTQELAEPGKALLSEHTAALVEGYLELVDCGFCEPKGAGGPLRMYELAGHGPATGRVEAASQRGLSPFVGREQEMDALEQALTTALSGQGQVVGIVGDAGVGKSRLCHEFAESCRARGVPVYHLAGQAHLSSVPMAPVLQLLRDFFGIGEHDSDRVARERISKRLTGLDRGFRDELPLIFDFLGVPDPERPAEQMAPEARQRRLLALMRRLTRAQSAEQPGVLVFEDLHWLDAASEAYLANHVEALQGTRGLTVVDFRPEYHAKWMARSYYRQIALSPLDAAATRRLLSDLLGSDPSLDGLSELIGERSEGNPFFMEEIVQAQVEEGSLVGSRGAYRLMRPIDQVSVPASVQAVLAARIDRLGERKKAVLGAASVIGRGFSGPTLERVAGLPPEELEEALRELVSAEFIYEQEAAPEPIFAFRHPLTQQVVYESQLEERRRALHAAVAEAIASADPERIEERAGLLAGHWEAAGEQLEAARWHARAGGWAGSGDPAEALVHWRRVRELSDQLPESPKTLALGLAARTSLLMLGRRRGISREEARQLFGEAEQMAEQAGDIRSQALVLANYGLIKGLSEGELGDAAKLERRAMALAEEAGDPVLYLALVQPAGYGLYLTGESREAVALADRAIELAGGDPTIGAGLATACPYAACHGYRGLNLAVLGELEEAGRAIARGRAIAHEQNAVEVVGWAYLFSANLAYFLGQPGMALDHAQRGLEIAERIGDSFARSNAWFFLGMAQRMRGRWDLAIEALETSGAISPEFREHREPTRLAFLAESHLGLGDVDRAKAAAEEAMAIAPSQGNVLGELAASLATARVLLGADGPAARTEIEAALAHALELIGSTGDRAFEPQVHVELAELARRSGDVERRQEELREAHRLFTEIGAGGYADGVARELARPLVGL